MTLFQPDLWGEVKASIPKPIDNFYRRPNGEDFPTYRLDEWANPDRCWKCKSAIWVALCRTGFRTQLDDELVTPQQDLDYYLSRRRTFEVYKLGDRFMIQLRTPQRILSDRGDRPALPEHKCDFSNIRKDVQLPWTTTKTKTETTEEAPF